jgi:hypothetical protein
MTPANCFSAFGRAINWLIKKHTTISMISKLLA